MYSGDHKMNIHLVQHLNFVMRPTVIAHSCLWIFAKITQDRNRTNPENHLFLERGGSGPHGFSSVAGRSFAWIHQKSSRQQCSGFATPPTCQFFNQL